MFYDEAPARTGELAMRQSTPSQAHDSEITTKTIRHGLQSHAVFTVQVTWRGRELLEEREGERERERERLRERERMNRLNQEGNRR